MFKSWIVFPPNVQPTIAQAKVWNAHVHELRGVHWGTERNHPSVLAVEVDSESLYSQMQHCEAFDALVEAWLRRGAEIRDTIDFVPDRNALKPTKRATQVSQPAVRILPSARQFWETKEATRDVSAAAAVQASRHTRPSTRVGSASQDNSRTAPWLLVGMFAAGTIALGAYVVSELSQAGIESRRDTIERIDDSTRDDPRISVPPTTEVSGQDSDTTLPKQPANVAKR